MKEFVLMDASVKIGLKDKMVDLSSYVRAVTVTYSVELLDKSAMGTSFRRRIAGLKDWTAAVEFNQDYDAGKVDAILFAMIGAESQRIEIKKDSKAVSKENPLYHGDCLLPDYTPITGSVGALAIVSVTFQGDGILKRST